MARQTKKQKEAAEKTESEELLAAQAQVDRLKAKATPNPKNPGLSDAEAHELKQAELTVKKLKKTQS